jgi:ACR3 family arsenite efflux pump ArsB
MELIWNTLAGGDDELCAVPVTMNSVFQIVMYNPLTGVPVPLGLLYMYVALWARRRFFVGHGLVP